MSRNIQGHFYNNITWISIWFFKLGGGWVVELWMACKAMQGQPQAAVCSGRKITQSWERRHVNSRTSTCTRPQMLVFCSRSGVSPIFHRVCCETSRSSQSLKPIVTPHLLSLSLSQQMTLLPLHRRNVGKLAYLLPTHSPVTITILPSC